MRSTPARCVKRVPANVTVPECHPTLSAAWTSSFRRGMGTSELEVRGIGFTSAPPKQSTTSEESAIKRMGSWICAWAHLS